MCPPELLGETRQETSRRDGSRFASAYVGDISEIAIELCLVIVPQRELPGPVVALSGRGKQLTCQGLMIAHQPTGLLAQCNDARSSKGGDVYDR